MLTRARLKLVLKESFVLTSFSNTCEPVNRNLVMSHGCFIPRKYNDVLLYSVTANLALIQKKNHGKRKHKSICFFPT